ncbi:SAM-dependent methyltransferase [Demetria terragena]|uniref:SAM-dependent methyltransferase n=1 Tax=Demetria terragena TaxID=63959 RepID=UPI00039B4095|nr:SAM-dependent methyltransferase [Demetria terragena]
MTWRPWESAWHDALYGPNGFYRRHEGPAGHFATSAQGIPGVGRVLAQAVLALMARHELGSFVEIGSGRGELLTTLRTLDPDIRLQGCDVVPRPVYLPDSIEWLESPGGSGLPDGPFTDSLVFAHEWLDVIPVPVVELGTDGPRLVEVDSDGDERLGGSPSQEDLGWCEDHWPLTEFGARAEIGRPREIAWEALCERSPGSLVVAVDYGHEISARPLYGSLTAFVSGREAMPLPDGSRDITAHVAVDTLVAARRVSQHDVLHELGVIPPRPDHDLARTDPPSYLAALAHRQAAQHASASPGLGDFWWVLRKT